MIAIALRETDATEVEKVAALRVEPAERASLTALLPGLRGNEAVLLPGPNEAGGRARRFVLGQRRAATARWRRTCGANRQTSPRSP